MRRNLVQEYFEERVSFGNMAATRAEVYDDVIDLGHPHRAADMFAAKAPAVSDEQWAKLPRLKTYRAKMAEGMSASEAFLFAWREAQSC